MAQALIHDPKILILDEPTTGLDPNQIVEIRNLIRELGEHKTVVLSTHILPEVEATCDRILIINKGKIVADGTSASLRSQGEGNEVVNYAFENAKIDEIRQSISELKGVSEVKIKDMEALKVEVHSSLGKDTRREVFKMSVDKGWALLEMIPEETKLEDIFRKLTLN